MGFLKKTIMALGALILILWGGAGTQSNSTLLQGGGFIGLIIGLIVLYIFTKMAWRAMGCLPSLIIILGIFSFIIYAIGGFSNGVGGIIPNLKAFLGQQPTTAQTTGNDNFSLIDDDDIGVVDENGNVVEETVVEEEMPNLSQEKKPQQQTASSFQKIMGSLSGQQKQPQPDMNPANFPAIIGQVRVINGDTLMMNGRYIRLYGIDAPETDQTCANRSGRSYHCGRQATTWLRNWLADNEVECRIMQQDAKGNMVGTCSLGQYDLGAALVNAGWAVAYQKYTDIYVPYQQLAMQKRDGLWQGKFYMPSDWKVMKTKKPKIKVVKPKAARKSMW